MSRPSSTLGTGAGGTQIKRAHVAELRQRATRGTSTLSGGGPSGGPVPTDGHASLSYDQATNRINTAGWEYDSAGNQTRTLTAAGTWQRLEYDAANRLISVKTDAGAVLAAYTYGDSNARLITHQGGGRTYYAWGAGGVVSEYFEADGTATANAPQWAKNYVYLGGRLLATQTPGANGEHVEYHHPDRLGTRVVTNAANASHFEQAALPFGTALDGESTGATNRRFTSYDRSQATGLDYAVNRHYDPTQGRFTQVDPIEMDAVSLDDPQTLNLYSYCGNDPINHTDPDGLFFKKLFKGVWKVLTSKWFALAVGVALAVLSFGSSAGWWALSKAVSVPVGMNLGAGAVMTTVIQTTTLGWVAGALSTALAIPGLTSVSGLLQRAGGFGIGQALGGVGGGSISAGGTPDWNPDGNEFQRGPGRRWWGRRARGGYRNAPGRSWSEGLRHVGGVWRVGGGQGRPAPLGYSKAYPEDIPNKNPRNNKTAWFASEGEARAVAFQKLGIHPVEVAPNKWRSFNGRWQYRAKPGDFQENHVHLERLNPATGQVLENWHLNWPQGKGRQ